MNAPIELIVLLGLNLVGTGALAFLVFARHRPTQRRAELELAADRAVRAAEQLHGKGANFDKARAATQMLMDSHRLSASRARMLVESAVSRTK